VSEEWGEIRAVPPGSLGDATLELHEAVQAIASAGQALATPRDDDSHRGMRWWRGAEAFVGEPLGPGEAARVGVRPADLTLFVTDGGGTERHAFTLGGRTRAEGFGWLEEILSGVLGLAELTLSLPEFTIPEGPAARGEAFSADRGRERRVLSALYSGAAARLEALAAERAASEVRCWPHHFDIATLITVRPADEREAARTVGVGLAPMGGGYEGWYWYVNAWPPPDLARLAPLRVGHWHSEGWTGAVLTGEELVGSGGEPADTLGRFLEDAIRAAERAVLS